MGKVFCHKPLKRSELRRLSEPPKPVEAAPGPTVRLEEPVPDPDRERRAQEKLARRMDERKLAEVVETFATHCKPVVVRGTAFLRWLIEGLEAAPNRDAFIQGSNIVTLPESIGQCLVCGADDPVVPSKSAFVVWPDVFPRDKTGSIAAVACGKCCNLQPRLFASQLGRLVWGTHSSTEMRALANRRMRKVELLENDRGLLEWVASRRPGNDQRMVMRAMADGRFHRVLQGVEDLIVNEDQLVMYKISEKSVI